MPQLRIEIKTIESLAVKIKAEHDGTISDLINRLRSIDKEIDSAWNGPAQEQFKNAYGDWITDLERYSDNLNSIYQYLTSVANNFRELDDAARAAAANASKGRE